MNHTIQYISSVTTRDADFDSRLKDVLSDMNQAMKVFGMSHPKPMPSSVKTDYRLQANSRISITTPFSVSVVKP